MSSHRHSERDAEKHRAEENNQQDEREQNSSADGGAVNPSVIEGPSVEKIVSDELEKLAAEKSDLKNTLIRLQADFDNYRKRTDRERHSERHRGAEVIVESILPVLDGFERAISSHRDAAHNEYREGFQLIRKQLLDALSKHGLQKIDAVGKPFDPNFHHAIERVETSEQPDDAVLEELQSGYIFHGKVLRPAMVRVAANPAGHAAASNRRDN
ncbi:MAG TPA: nucleotide exchange factor GrpE [Candidatus Acidoferrales bacterium]|nr:nucleotide exchange factor GrpE [Candidatus Acidoferrales bacterium]